MGVLSSFQSCSFDPPFVAQSLSCSPAAGTTAPWKGEPCNDSGCHYHAHLKRCPQGKYIKVNSPAFQVLEHMERNAHSVCEAALMTSHWMPAQDRYTEYSGGKANCCSLMMHCCISSCCWGCALIPSPAPRQSSDAHHLRADINPVCCHKNQQKVRCKQPSSWTGAACKSRPIMASMAHTALPCIAKPLECSCWNARIGAFKCQSGKDS